MRGFPGGYVGKILEVDLSKKETKEVELPPEVYRKYIGGAGLAAYIIYKRLKDIKDPLHESNVLVFAPGPMEVDGVPFTRITVASISPLTGIWGEARAGTRFANEIKKAGFDAVVITGKAEKPSYLYIHDGEVEIRDATKYWGMGIPQTLEGIRKELNDPTLQGMAIGPAGENLVKFALIANEEGFAGRCGMGAVMGSKNLKAIVAKGSLEVPVAYPDELKAFVKELVKKLAKAGEASRKYGTAGGVKPYHAIGNLPIRNFLWGRWDDEKIHKISGEYLAEKYLKHPFACTFCPIACKRYVRIKDGKYFKEFEGLGPEYETIGLLASNLLLDDMEALIKANHLCDVYGLDTISTGGVIGFLFEAAEKGLVDKNLEGLNLEWESAETIHKLIEKIAYREGIGDILAEGVKKAAEKLGGEEFAVHIKGLEMPAHDGRAFWSHGLSFATMNRGACHLGLPHVPYKGVSLPEFGIQGKTNRYDDSEEMIRTVIIMQNLMTLYDSLVLCKFAWGNTGGAFSFTDLSKLMSLVTGDEWTPQDLEKAGDRIWKLQRRINNELGITSVDDKLPLRMVTPHANRDDTKVPPIEKWLPKYYELRNLTEDGKVKDEDLDFP